MKKKKGGVLADHKKVKSKFIPPMMQLPGGFEEVGYVKQILPQLLWVGLINRTVGKRAGINIVNDICENAEKIKSRNKFLNLAVTSNYNLLPNDEKEQLIEALERSKKLETLRHGLEPLTSLFPEFPMSFFGLPENCRSKKELVNELRTALDEHFDRRELPGMILQTTAVYIRGANGGLFLTGNVEAPDLNAIIQRPESDDAKRAVGFVRSSINMEFMKELNPEIDEWPKYFWKSCYRLDNCEFEDPLDADE